MNDRPSNSSGWNYFWPSRSSHYLRWSVLLIIVGIISWILSDWTVYASQPAKMLTDIGKGLLFPAIRDISQLIRATLITLSFSIIAVSLAFSTGIVLSLVYKNPLVAALCALLRSVHELFWALLFLQLFGLSWLTALLAIVLPFSAIFGRVFYDIYQQRATKLTSEIVKIHIGRLSIAQQISFLFYDVLPQCWPAMKSYLRYRLECGFRTAAVLGFVGIPTLGYYLESYFREAHYAEAGAYLLSFILLIFGVRFWFKIRWLPMIFVLAIVVLFLSDNSIQFSHFHWHTLFRFASEDIWPTAVRNEANPLQAIYTYGIWLINLLLSEALPGLWLTLLLTISALALVLLFTQIQLAVTRPMLEKKSTRSIIHFALLLMRSVPEYILAFILLLLWGPSMLPAAVALAIHNSGLIGYLMTTATEKNVLKENKTKITGENLFQKQPNTDLLSQYFYRELPQNYPSFFSLLLYRAEIIFRESTILGILGLGTIGFYLDSAFEDFRMDKAFALLMLLVLANILFDFLSRKLQRAISGQRSRIYSAPLTDKKIQNNQRT